MKKEESDNSVIDSKWYLSFLADVKVRIESAQYEASRAVNGEPITPYLFQTMHTEPEALQALAKLN